MAKEMKDIEWSNELMKYRSKNRIPLRTDCILALMINNKNADRKMDYKMIKKHSNTINALLIELIDNAISTIKIGDSNQNFDKFCNNWSHAYRKELKVADSKIIEQIRAN